MRRSKTINDYKIYMKENAKHCYKKNKEYKKAYQKARYRDEALTRERFNLISQQEQEL